MIDHAPFTDKQLSISSVCLSGHFSICRSYNTTTYTELWNSWQV